ncbi:hypothetical protein HGRIS_006034 [Hohenbuehelia grisea]|uniref:Tcp11-domain-containing protein n=1 Tax=Hohenbuehelia grisea TaxID=104357 RepID=A0ABR3K0W5_9AGAR
MDPLTNRKRKAEVDDCPEQDQLVAPDSLRVDPSAPPKDDAPRHPWMGPYPTGAWSPSSPTATSPLSSSQMRYDSPPSKRQRVQDLDASQAATHGILPDKTSLSRKRSSSRVVFPTRPPNDIEDIGIVSSSAAGPGPSTGSLLHLRESAWPPSTPSRRRPPPPQATIDLNALHIPSLQPPINRQTLRELDLENILQNPQLRHDLLFDPGLQFRPITGRRKRENTEGYWSTVLQELETGCTCVSFDMRGKPHSTICACSQVPLPPVNRVYVYVPSKCALTIRTPSRLLPLLSEFLEVLVLVIQPLSSTSGVCVNPKTYEAQMQEHSVHAAYLRSLIDPQLIEQQLRHSTFDPSGLFQAVGTVLKRHCAPMRDRAVEFMIQIAHSCAPGGVGRRADAVKALRTCMDILELMKLDIANHQIQSLRPFLIKSSGKFEWKTFKARRGGQNKLYRVRQWLEAAHQEMLACKHTIPNPLRAGDRLSYDAMHRNQQTYVSVNRAFSDLVFSPPAESASLTSPPLTSTPTQLPGYPENTFLDSARLHQLSADASDTTAIYMYLLLYRQLLHAEAGDSRSSSPEGVKVDDAELLKLKNEIRAIGSTYLGRCLSAAAAPSGVPEKWRSVKDDIVLQVVRRAQQARNRSTGTDTADPCSEVPDEQLLNIARRWTDTHMRAGSPLSVMLRNRLRDVVFNSLLTLVYPGSDGDSKLSVIEFTAFTSSEPAVDIPVGKFTGMEPLFEEIRFITQRLARLAVIHLNAYLPVYEQEKFWASV